MLSRFFSPLPPFLTAPELAIIFASGFPGGKAGFISNIGGGGGTNSGNISAAAPDEPPLGGGGGLMVAYMAGNFPDESGTGGMAVMTMV